MTDRVIALVDMDCFYVQVEQRLNPNLVGKPCAVVQYNAYRGGGIIAVNYEARAKGVNRNTRGDDAKKICPEIELPKVPELNGKADLTRYRNAGCEVIEVLSSFVRCVERASIDEAYIDLTEEVNSKITNMKVCIDDLKSTYVVGLESGDEDRQKIELEKWLEDLYDVSYGSEDDLRLVVGAYVVEQMRAKILEVTGFKCSAGIAHNKVLAKLACGIHKPNRQTVVPQSSVSGLFEKLPLSKVRNLGGKLGSSLKDKLGCETMADIAKFTEKELRKHFGDKNGSWLFALGKGFDDEPIKERYLPKSIGCSKNFPGRLHLSTLKDVKFWLEKFATELNERLVKDRDTNNRVAKLLNVSVRYDFNSTGLSRSCALHSYEINRIVESAFAVLSKVNGAGPGNSDAWEPPIISLGISATKFQDSDGKSASCLENFLRSHGKSNNTVSIEDEPSRDSEKINIATTSEEHKQVNSDYDGTTDEDPDDPPALNCFPNGEKQPEVTGDCLQSKEPGFFATKLNRKPVGVSLDTQRTDKLPADGLMSSTERTGGSETSTEDIDQEVLSSLPFEIQAEIRMQIASKLAKEEVSKCASGGLTKVGIQKFFASVDSVSKPKSAEVDGTPSDTMTKDETVAFSEDEVFCDKCHKKFLVWDWIEHQDYHVAMELSDTFRGSQVVARASPSASKSTESKKRGRKGTKKLSADKKSRTIDSFFLND